MTAATVDRAPLRERIDECVRQINVLMRTHAGALEVVELTAAGVLTVRFTAMCQGCPFRAVTMYGLVKPLLEGVDGVVEVRAQGVRVSEEAAERAAAAMTEGTSWLPAPLRLSPKGETAGVR
jgi:Fe-S cluster biogenesis protein NfuA